MTHALTRRVLVAAAPAITALSVAALGHTALAHPTVAGPDAELIALGAELTEALALKDKLYDAADLAYETYTPTPIPDALFWRPSDVPAVWNANPGVNLDGVGRDDEVGYAYAREDIRPKLVQRLERLRAPSNARCPRQEDIDRLEKIIEAFDAWMAAEAKVCGACGFTAAQQASDRQYAVVTSLLRRIGGMRACTAAGICVKARAAFAASHKSIALVEAHGFAELSGKTDFAVGELEELLTMSMMIDVHKLDAAIGIERDAA